jgi:NADH-quinone oxidoreductase subunit G
MIRSRGIAFGALDEDGRFDSPLGESTGAAQIFGASGGVMEAMLRTAAHLKGVEDQIPLEWKQLRGVQDAVKTASIPGVGTVAVCNGIAAAQRMLETDDWRTEFVAIEVMACSGGCLGGGGEPKSMDPDVLKKRSKAIFDMDANAPRRCSYENPDVRKLYEAELGEPNSKTAHALLHTAHIARHSERALLARFLDCVDRRDGAAAASLFHQDGVWSTASPFGDISGAANIAALISSKLPPRKYGPHFARHRLDTSSRDDDLIVITPDGQKCRFTMELCSTDLGGRSPLLIRRLERHVL